jgi:hypothetical protein
MAIKYINIFQSKTLQNFPKLGFLVWKQTIWQPWSRLGLFSGCRGWRGRRRRRRDAVLEARPRRTELRPRPPEAQHQLRVRRQEHCGQDKVPVLPHCCVWMLFCTNFFSRHQSLPRQLDKARHLLWNLKLCLGRYLAQSYLWAHTISVGSKSCYNWLTSGSFSHDIFVHLDSVVCIEI